MSQQGIEKTTYHCHGCQSQCIHATPIFGWYYCDVCTSNMVELFFKSKQTTKEKEGQP